METPITDIGTEVFETLKNVLDPEIGLNIVDLGLVYKASLDQGKLLVEMTLTTPGCPMSNTITTAAEQILQERFPALEVEVELVWTPMWTPDSISEEGMRQLNGM